MLYTVFCDESCHLQKDCPHKMSLSRITERADQRNY